MDPIAFRGVELLVLALMVPLFVIIGYRLFLLGATGKIKVVGELKEHGKITVTDLAPGSFCFLLGVVLAGFLIFDRLQYTKTDGKNTEHVVSMTPPVVGPVPAGAAISAPVPDVGVLLAPNSPSAKVATGITPQVPSRVALPTTGDQVVISWLTGSAGSEPLSIRLSKAIKAMDQCKKTLSSTTDCDTLFYGKFHSMPSAADLSNIQRLEAHAKADRAAAAELARIGDIYE